MDSINIALALFLFFLGSILASFFNVLCNRMIAYISDFNYLNNIEKSLNYQNKLLKKLSFSSELSLLCQPSFCPNCLKYIYWKNNIPIISYLLLKGRCASCQKSICFFYFFSEIFFAFFALSLYLMTFYQWINPFQAISLFIFFFLSLAIAIIDLKTLHIPNFLNFLLLWSGLTISIFALWIDANNSIFAVLISFVFLFGLNLSYRLIRNYDGLGFGDIYFLCAISGYFGIQSLFWISFIASSFALLVFIFLWLAKKISWQTKIPFAPYIALASYLYIILFLLQII